MLGHDVTIFEERGEAGGMLRFAIPEYRLPKSVLRRELDLIEGVGVKMVFNTRIGFDVPLNELASQFDAVFLSIGTWKESWLYLPGTELKNVHTGAAFSRIGRQERKAIDGSQGGDHRRRQRGHRFGPHGDAHGRERDDSLSPRAQGHARHRRGDSGRRGGGRSLCLPGRAAPHTWRCRGTREGYRDRQDAAGRVRQIRAQKTDSHRRGAALRV